MGGAAGRGTRERRVARARPLLAAGLVLSISALAACTSGGSVATGTGSVSRSSAASSSPSAAPSAAGGPAGALQAQYEKVIAKVLPSVVEITTSQGLGSGIVLDNQGDIVTNDHVVGTARSFMVRLASSPSPVPATLRGTFPPDDLAVVRVKDASGLHPASFADSSKVKVGEITLAMGNPLGLASSVTDGIVSAVGRTLSEPTSPDSPGATLPDSIQTSAAINPGNSGGALVDLQGKVIGIPTLAATDQQQGGAAPGIGFAIPSNTVVQIGRQLAKSGTVTHSDRAALGVEVQTVVGPSGSGSGVGVRNVQAGGGAAKAGLRSGDVITSVNGKSVQTVQQLSTVLAGLKVGQDVKVTVERNGQSKTFTVTLGQLHSS